MYSKVLVSFLVFGLVLADKQFNEFQGKFDKKYSPKEFAARKAIFQANLKEISKHNEKYLNGEVSYKKQIDQFTDLTREEMAAKINGKFKIYP